MWHQSETILLPANLKQKRVRKAHNSIGALLRSDFLFPGGWVHLAMINRIKILLLIGLAFWGCATVGDPTVRLLPMAGDPFQPQRASDCGELHYRLNKIELENITTLDRIHQGGNSYKPAKRFFPKFMFGDETTKIVQNGPTNRQFKLYDDGTHGDDISGDGIYSRSCISMNDLNINYTLFDGMAALYSEGDAELFIINPKLRGKIKFEDYGDGLQGTANALFVALGNRYEFIYRKENGPLHNPKTSISAKRVLSQFGDVFDHLVFVPDVPFGGATYFRIRDDVQGIMTYGDPLCYTGMWGSYSPWRKPSDYKYENVDFGCYDKFLGGNDYLRLKGNIWNGWSRSMNGLNHEFGHWMGIGPSQAYFPGPYLSWNSQDRMHINSTSTVSNVMTGPLWDPKKGWPNSVRVKDENGIWKEVQIESNDDGTFTMVPRNPMKHEGYDDILLYMMGFKSPEDANKRYYLFYESDINLNDCFYQDDSKGEPYNATAGPSGLYCYDNIIDQSEYGNIVEFGVQEMIDMFGPRVPSYDDAPKHLNVGVIILTRDIASEAMRAWYHLLYGWWANENEWHDALGGTWPFVTRGLATIKTGIPK